MMLPWGKNAKGCYLTKSNYLIFSILIFLFFLFFYRYFFKFKFVPGFYNDSLLNQFIMEHWFRFFRGKENLFSPPMFYPVKHTLGYTDALFLFSLPYGFLRIVGFNKFSAYQLTLLLVHLWGSMIFYYFLLKILRFPPWLSFLGCVVALFSNAVYLSLAHPQLLALAFIPILMFSGIRFLQNVGNHFIRRFAYALCFLFFYASLFITGFYIAWFFTLFLVLLFFFFFLFNVIFSRELLKISLLWIKSHFIETLLYFVLFLGFMIPFFLIYLPVVHQFGPRPWQDISLMLPTPIDLINVGPKNLFWGIFIRKFIPTIQKRAFWWELMFGTPLFTLVGFLTAILGMGVYVTIENKTLLKNKTINIPFSLGLTVLTIWIFILKINSTRTIWKIFYEHKIIPGIGAIRAVFRVQLVLGIAISIVLCYLIFYIITHLRKYRTVHILIFFLFISIILEQINIANPPHFSKNDTLKFLKHVPTPPKGYKVFFMKPSKSENMHELSVKAMLMAQRFDLCAINGYSGQFPPYYPFSYIENYNSAIPKLKFWLALHNVYHPILCYNSIKNTWETLTLFSIEKPIPLFKPLKNTEYRAKITIIHSPRMLKINEKNFIKVKVTNKSTTVFSIGDKHDNFGIKMAYQWIRPTGEQLGFHNRIPIYLLKPNQTKIYDLSIKAPSTPGFYILEIDLLQEKVAWFKEKGNKTARVTIHITEKK